MNNHLEAGIITELDNGEYTFAYNDQYLADAALPAISLTLPKTRTTYTAKTLFPFFANMLSEGSNRVLQSQLLKIDEADDFGFLLKTAAGETIGAITVEEIE
jgi:HipA-like protein